MATNRDRVSKRGQSFSQPHRRRSVSGGDVTYVLGSLLFSSMRVIPAPQRIRVINRASPFLSRLVYMTNIYPTRRIRANLRAVLSSDHPPDAFEAATRRLLSVIVWNALMTNTLPALTRQQIVDLVPIDGLTLLDGYLANSHPVLIWGYHFGVSPLIVAALLHARGYPVHVITRVRQTPARASMLQFFYFFQLQPISEQLSVIDPTRGAQRKMLDVLRAQECLFVTPDYMLRQDEMHPKSAFEVSIDFLGRGARLQVGSLRLAKRLGAKVLTVLSTQVDERGRRLIVEPFDLPTSGLAPAELQQDLQMCMRRLESQVLACPYWWLDLKRNDLVQRLREPRA